MEALEEALFAPVVVDVVLKLLARVEASLWAPWGNDGTTAMVERSTDLGTNPGPLRRSLAPVLNGRMHGRGRPFGALQHERGTRTALASIRKGSSTVAYEVAVVI